MESIRLAGTERTPEVAFDPQSGTLRMVGCCIHENTEAFFRPLLDRAEAYVGQPAAHTTIQIFLDYFNSSTAKYLLDLLKLFDGLHHAQPGTVELEWHYEADDLDMQEAGSDYKALLDMPVHLVSGPIR